VPGLGDAPQNTILRYGRVPLCATSFVVHPADQAVCLSGGRKRTHGSLRGGAVGAPVQQIRAPIHAVFARAVVPLKKDFARNVGGIQEQSARREIPANLVGLEGSTVIGMSFTFYRGRATWDHIGKSSSVRPVRPTSSGRSRAKSSICSPTCRTDKSPAGPSASLE